MADTRGRRALEAAGVEHRMLEYDYRRRAAAVHAASELGVEPRRMLKSLVATAAGEFAFALVPADGELSLKLLAQAMGAKSAAMASPHDAERVTGYRVGGISPLGARTPLPVYLDAGAAAYDRVCLNAGGQGKIVEVATADLVALTGASVVPLTA